jgi:hypothetical protein
LPGNHPIHLALPLSAAIDNGSMVNRGIAAQPLLPQHGNEGGKEGSRQTRVEDGLDADDGTIGAIPYWEGGIGTGGDVPKRGTGDDLEEGVVHLIIIRFEVALNVDDKSRCDRGEQSGLFPSDSRDRGGSGRNTHKDQGVVQVFAVLLVEIAVMLISCALELLVELDAGVVGRWFGDCVLQAETTGKRD